MKKLPLIALILTAFASCQKSNLSLVKDKWSGYYSMDTVSATSKADAESKMVDCPNHRKWNADTVLSYNNGEPEAVAQTWQEITPGDTRFIDRYVVEVSPGFWQRLVFNFDNKQTN